MNQTVMTIQPNPWCRLRTDTACAVVGEVYPPIGIFTGCSRALARALAIRWTMMIAPPNEPVLMTGTCNCQQSVVHTMQAALRHPGAIQQLLFTMLCQHAGAPVIEMYHLVHGVCVARTSGGIHIDTLAEGSAIGHLDAVLGTPCGADILAKTYCTMYCLSVLELHEVFEVCSCKLSPWNCQCDSHMADGYIPLYAHAGLSRRGKDNSRPCKRRT